MKGILFCFCLRFFFYYYSSRAHAGLCGREEVNDSIPLSPSIPTVSTVIHFMAVPTRGSSCVSGPRVMLVAAVGFWGL